MVYGFTNGLETKEDPISLIVKHESTSGYIKTKCPVGCEINKKMQETHKLLKGM